MEVQKTSIDLIRRTEREGNRGNISSNFWSDGIDIWNRTSCPHPIREEDRL
jgi:hypothetical protein